MTHVSKQKLDDKYLRDLYLEFISALERSSKRGELREVLDQFLTKTERIMFTKRLTVINMLSQKIPIFTISESLSMSPSTIDLMSLQFEIGNYEKIIKHALPKSNIDDVIREIMTVSGIMPPMGKGRWKSLDASLRRKRVQNRIAKLAERKKSRNKPK